MPTSNYYSVLDDVIMLPNSVMINGVQLPPCPAKKYTNVTQINGKVFINGYEFKHGKWKRTLRALWHYIF